MNSPNNIEKGIIEFLQNKYNSTIGSIKDFKDITTGWETRIFSFNLETHEKQQQKEELLILRIYSGTPAAQTAEREYRILKNLHKMGFSVPEVFFFETDKKYIGKPFVIMQRIEGKNMGELFLKSTSEKQMKLLDEFCKIFVKLHDLNWKIFSENTIKADQSYNFINSYIERYKRDIKHFKKTELLPIIRWLEKYREKITTREVAFTHNDFHPHNILIDKKGKHYTIDWSSGRLDDYRTDLGWTLLLSRAYLSKSIRNKILKQYEIYANDKVQGIEYFEVMAILRRLLDISISISLGGQERGMREDTINQIKQSIGHLRGILERLKEITSIEIEPMQNLIDEMQKKQS